MLSNRNSYVKKVIHGFHPSYEHTYIPPSPPRSIPREDFEIDFSETESVYSCASSDSYSSEGVFVDNSRLRYVDSVFDSFDSMYMRPTRKEVKYVEQMINAENARKDCMARRVAMKKQVRNAH
jgi:hypothetical protein